MFLEAQLMDGISNNMYLGCFFIALYPKIYEDAKSEVERIETCYMEEEYLQQLRMKICQKMTKYAKMFIAYELLQPSINA